VKQGADAFEDSVGVARRAVKQSGDAAEEFLNDTTGACSGTWCLLWSQPLQQA